MKKNILLISKEVLRKDFLGIYNPQKKTPHINNLASNGTIFNNYYTCGGSTAMAVTSMLAGINCYEIADREYYCEVDKFDQCETIFQKFIKLDYECHVVWPKHFENYVDKYLKIFDKQVNVHPLKRVSVIIPSTIDKSYFGEYEVSDMNDDGALIYMNEIENILNNASKPVFIWAHFPHILTPYKSIESDIIRFDEVIGKLYSKKNTDLFLTADHGCMYGEKTEYMYGFTAYQGTVNIPLITPELPLGKMVDFNVGSSQLMDIILTKEVHEKEFVYYDTQYYKQSGRIFMLLSDKYKYIYNKCDHTEELYDLNFDPKENINLLKKYYYLKEKNIFYPIEEVITYPDWEIAEKYYNNFKTEKKRIWKTGSFLNHLLHKLRILKSKLISKVFFASIKVRKNGLSRWKSSIRQ